MEVLRKFVIDHMNLTLTELVPMCISQRLLSDDVKPQFGQRQKKWEYRLIKDIAQSVDPTWARRGGDRRIGLPLCTFFPEHLCAFAS
jgi:hypothetical protein